MEAPTRRPQVSLPGGRPRHDVPVLVFTVVAGYELSLGESDALVALHGGLVRRGDGQEAASANAGVDLFKQEVEEPGTDTAPPVAILDHDLVHEQHSLARREGDDRPDYLCAISGDTHVGAGDPNPPNVFAVGDRSGVQAVTPGVPVQLGDPQEVLWLCPPEVQGIELRVLRCCHLPDGPLSQSTDLTLI